MSFYVSPLLCAFRFVIFFDVLKDVGRARKEEEETQGGAGERSIFFMWQMASFYVRVMSSSCLSDAGER
jgi:hypothetical protein